MYHLRTEGELTKTYCGGRTATLMSMRIEPYLEERDHEWYKSATFCEECIEALNTEYSLDLLARF